MKKSIKKSVKIFLACVLAFSIVMGSNAAQAAIQSNSGNWSVYYAYGGVYHTYAEVDLPASNSGTYRAKCDGVGGECTYVAITVTAFYKKNDVKHSLDLTKTLKFTKSGTVDFKIDTKIPGDVRNVTFGINLSYSNGRSAYGTGSVTLL